MHRSFIVVVLIVIATAVRAQNAWTPLPDDSARGATGARTVEEGETRLEIRGVHLVRVGAGGETTLRTLPGRPTGAIAALVRDDNGGTFVAAEHGIFLTHPSVETLDRLDLKDGAPPGPPVGIVLDDRRRLWVATRTHFGVIHTGFFYGRTHSAADGLPPGPYSGLRRHPDGGLVLKTDNGLWKYVPDTGPPPRVTGTTVDGRPYDGTTPLARTWPVSIEVSASGTGTGGATLRHVKDGHHNWRRLLDEGRIFGGMNPGRRSIHIIALDRDLRRSAEHVIPVSVAYPVWLRPGYLLGGILMAMAGLLVTLLLRARRAGGGRRRYTRAALSSLILSWLVLQIIAGVFPHARGWPLCGFSMYTGTTKENAVSGWVGLMRTDAGGVEHPARLGRFGLVFDSHWQIVRPFMNGDDAFKREMLERYNAHDKRRQATGLRVVHSRMRLTRDGKIRVAPLVMAATRRQR